MNALQPYKEHAVSPFEGKPDTKQVVHKDGRVSFHIQAQELTPKGIKRAEWYTEILTWLWFAAAVYGWLDQPNPEFIEIAVNGGLPWLVRPFAKKLFMKEARKKTEMMIGTDKFALRERKRWKTFDRRIEHRFSLIPHDKAREEAEDNEFAVRSAQAAGNAIRKKRYYGDSYHLTYEYMGQRHDIAEIYGRKEAMAVLARLKACDSVMDMQASRGKAVTMRPEDEWGEQPGALPEA